MQETVDVDSSRYRRGVAALWSPDEVASIELDGQQARVAWLLQGYGGFRQSL